MPDFAIERQCQGLVCGIDEAGRGPAGRASGCRCGESSSPAGSPRCCASGLDDSKVLTREQREACYRALRRCADRGAARIGVGAASTVEIDRLNILRAALLAMARAVAVLGVRPDIALVDGAIAPPLTCPVRTVVKGDALSFSIAAASVVAKVTRDRIMRGLGSPLPRLWLGDQCRIRNAGAWRGNPPARHHPPSSTFIRTGATRRCGRPAAFCRVSRRAFIGTFRERRDRVPGDLLH